MQLQPARLLLPSVHETPLDAGQAWSEEDLGRLLDLQKLWRLQLGVAQLKEEPARQPDPCLGKLSGRRPPAKSRLKMRGNLWEAHGPNGRGA